MALCFRLKSLKIFKLFLLCSEVVQGWALTHIERGRANEREREMGGERGRERESAREREGDPQDALASVHVVNGELGWHVL